MERIARTDTLTQRVRLVRAELVLIATVILSQGSLVPPIILVKQQDLDNLRRKDSLRGADTAQISVHLGNYSASHFEGSAKHVLPEIIPTLTANFPFAQSTPHILNFKLPIERSTQPQPVQDGFLPP